MSKHTAGPWNVGEEGDVYAEQSACIATVCGAPEGITEAGANARLIAAVPELLAALGQLLDRLDFHGNIDLVREEGPIDDARQAIAKAKGE